MNKYILIGAVIVVIGVGGWLYTHQTQTLISPSVAGQPTSTATQNTDTQQPIKTNPTVEKISWHTEMANPAITNADDFHKYEQVISIDITFSDKSTKRYNLGNAYGCSETTIAKLSELGRMKCNFSDSSSGFVAYLQSGRLVVKKEVESARDGSLTKTIVLEI